MTKNVFYIYKMSKWKKKIGYFSPEAHVAGGGGEDVLIHAVCLSLSLYIYIYIYIYIYKTI
jgi:hypothetical protein